MRCTTLINQLITIKNQKQMKQKVKLPELVEQLKNEQLQKRDFVVPASCIAMEEGRLIVFNKEEDKALNDLIQGTGIVDADDKSLSLKCLTVAHSQLSDKLQIPKKYYDRLNSDNNLELLDVNVSWWFQNNNKNNYFLRTFVNEETKKGFVRALLSDRFKVIDNYDVLFACLEAIKESGANVEIESCDLTEKRMYVRFIAPEIEVQAPELLKNYKSPNGESGKTGICTGFVISNSEVGQGTFSISPRAVVSVCSNGMVFKDDAFSKTHLGSKMDSLSKIEWSEQTKEKNKELIICQVQDAIKTFCSEEYIGTKIAQLQEKGAGKLVNPIDAVKNVSRHLSISEEKERDIMNYFLHSQDFSGFGITQALTYYAHNDANADEQADLEMQSVEILENINEFDVPAKKKAGSKWN